VLPQITQIKFLSGINGNNFRKKRLSKKLIKFLVYLQIKSCFQSFAIFIALKGQFNSAQGNALGK
jgi:hypothetical protein